MTPQQKADELFKKFFRVTPQPYTISQIEDGLWEGLKFNDWDRDWTNKMALQGAIICVEEILDNLSELDLHPLGTYKNPKVKHWQEVKQILTDKLK